MERKIGEIFKHNGEWYQCLIGNSCRECDFSSNNVTCDINGALICTCKGRSDETSVIFKKLEKVGEPYSIGTHIFQRYKVFIKPYIFNDPFFTVNTAIDDEFISIEIKQTKEEMEEKKINLKPFDLELAKQGKPVCTRDGRRARIICFNRNDLYPIVALIECEDGKEIIGAYSKEGQTEIYEIKGTDLMMLPEKKEGYVNLYHNSNDRYAGYLGNNVIYKDEEFARKLGKDCPNYIKTVKVEWEE